MNVRSHLAATFRAQRNVPTVWGVNDCLCVAAACAQPMIGRDPIAHLHDRYDSEISAKRLMVENGWNDMGDIAASIFPEIPVSQARAGDWVCLDNPDGSDALGVVIGDMIAAKTKESYAQAPLSQARRAFRVAP